MMLRVLMVPIWLSLAAVPLGAQDLDDPAIEQAIKAGQDNKVGLWSAQCKAGVSLSDKRKDGSSWKEGSVHFTGAYRVTLLTSAGRVALLAAEASGQSKSLSVKDVPEELRTNALHVIVDPIKPGSEWGGGVEVPSPIKGIILRSKSAPASQAEASRLEVDDVQWSEARPIMMTGNERGGFDKNRFKQSRATAMIPLQSARALPAGDLQIVILTTGAERRCDLGAKERLRLLR